SFHKNSNSGCNYRIKVPVQTGMIWKLRPREIESNALRQLIVDIFPKSEISSNLAPGLSEVQAYPIAFMEFHLSSLFQDTRKQSYSELISRLEGIQKAHSKERKLDNTNDSKIQLKIASDPRAKMQIVEKIIFDNFALLGIELDFIDIGENFVWKGADFDGLLMTIYDKSRRPFLSEALNPLKLFEDSQVDSDFKTKMANYRVDVEAFDMQISRGIVNQDILRKLLADFKKVHYWTPILNHSVCMNSTDGIRKKVFDQKDPDWFRGFIFE
ncbi:MAG: hypothetical protein NT027_03060, partial [Proteobacteria bacterium]|nr:hypothetical protein [Pseudomonadota bacterium]